MPVCSRCSDQIGPYEPAVIVDGGGGARETMPVRERRRSFDEGAWYHAACAEELRIGAE